VEVFHLYVSACMYVCVYVCVCLSCSLSQLVCQVCAVKCAHALTHSLSRTHAMNSDHTRIISVVLCCAVPVIKKCYFSVMQFRSIRSTYSKRITEKYILIVVENEFSSRR
jgi:hypothetical protein